MNIIKHLRIPAAFGILFGAAPMLFADVALVADGKPVSEIVVPADAIPSVKTAAKELQRHIESMSGAKLPVVNQASPTVANQLYVGQSEATKKMGLSVDDVKDDGFKIIAGKNHVIVAGREMPHSQISFSKFKDVERFARQQAWEEYTGKKWRFPPLCDYRDWNTDHDFHLWDGTGTLYAAYELLGQLGMRWYMPSELGLVIPKLKTISIKDQSLKREPEFPVRILTDSGNGQYNDEFLWYKSLGTGQAVAMPVYHSVSGPTEIVPTQQPQEYYGVVNGKIDYRVPKMTSERLRADMVEYLQWVDKAFPNIPYTSIGQPDGWSAMDDKDAAAGWDKTAERGPSGRFSDYNWEFSMDIRDRFMKKHPNEKFTIFAYADTHRIPSKLEAVPENVSIGFCQTSQSWMLPNSELDNRKEWMAKMSHKDQLVIWEYYIIHAPNYNFPPVPVIFPGLMKQSFDGLYDRAAGFLAEVGWNTAEQRKVSQMVMARPGISHLMIYLHSRLCWDRNTDLKAVANEYYDLFFGPAKAEMKEFFEFSESVWVRPEPRQITAAGGFLKPADVTRYFDILGRAKAKAGETIYGKRIDLIATEMEPLKLLFEKLKRTGPNIQIVASMDQPVIDGDLNKPFWRERPYTFTELREMINGETPQHVSTSVSFRWLNDNSALIVGIECMEPKMDKLKEGCKDSDSYSIFSDDTVEIRLETAQGIRPFFVINSAGVVLDECVTDNLADLPHFYKVSQAVVKKHADRWTAEVRIDAAPISGQRPVPFYPWGVNICRQRMAGNTPEHYMLVPSGTDFKEMKSMANIFVRN